MKLRFFALTCTLVAGLPCISYGAVVGSSRPEAQANFQKLIKTNSCPSCDLAGVVLTRINLSDANLENANLAGAQLFLTDLSDANLRNANLQGARLGGADLGGADLRGANLTGAILEGAYLKGAKIDGQVVSAASYADEGLSDVTEKKYVADESRGKNAPYTQDVVLHDSRISEQPAVTAVSEESEQQGAVPVQVQKKAQSKNVVPVANAVVHSSPARSDEKRSMVEPDDKSGFWGTVTSFFSKDAVDSQDDAGKAVTTSTKRSAPVAVSTAQPKTPVPMADAVVHVAKSTAPSVKETQPVVDTGKSVQAVEQEKSDDGGLWSSVTSFFKRGDKTNKAVQQESKKRLAEVEGSPAKVVSAGQTGKDNLAEDSGVRKMIEQIEGPAPEPEVAEVKKNVPVQESAVPQTKDPVTKTVSADTVPVPAEADQKTVTEEAQPVAKVAESPAEEVVEKKPAAEVKQAGALVYGVETPAQALENKQKILDRLFDDERCVGCDLAGVDLSGKNLEKVDLERVNLQGANLAGVDFDGANLKGAQLSGANLQEADLRDADLYLADFSGADLTGARFEGALIDSADFTGARGVNLAGTVKDE